MRGGGQPVATTTHVQPAVMFEDVHGNGRDAGRPVGSSSSSTGLYGLLPEFTLNSIFSRRPNGR